MNLCILGSSATGHLLQPGLPGHGLVGLCNLWERAFRAPLLPWLPGKARQFSTSGDGPALPDFQNGGVWGPVGVTWICLLPVTASVTGKNLRQWVFMSSEVLGDFAQHGQLV